MTPPHDLDAERSVIGAVLLDYAAPECIETVARMVPDHFFDARHQRTWQAVQSLADERAPIEHTSLIARLRDLGMLDQAGGVAYVASIDAGTSVNVAHYAQIVRDRALGRRCMSALGVALEKLSTGHTRSEEIVRAVAEDLVSVAAEVDRSDWVPVAELVREEIKRIETARDRGPDLLGLSTGLQDLDTATDGLHGGDLVVLGAPTGSGKSALAHGIASHAAINGSSVLVFSLEMSRGQIATRALASVGGVDVGRMRTGMLKDSEWPKLAKAADFLSKSRLSIDDTSGLRIDDIRAKCVRHKHRLGLDLAVVDYLQLASPSGDAGSREREVAAISRGLKIIAKDLEVPLIALSQLNDDGRVRESRAIEQDADCVWLIQRETDDQGDPTNEARLKIAKQRMGPAPQYIDLYWDGPHTRFRSATGSRHDRGVDFF